MTKKRSTLELAFSEPLGIASGGVISYPSDYETADEKLHLSRSQHRSYVGDNCDWDDDLIKPRYVIKPIVGKCGANIRLIHQEQKTLAEKLGMFGDRDRIYQQLFLNCYRPKSSSRQLDLDKTKLKYLTNIFRKNMMLRCSKCTKIIIILLQKKLSKYNQRRAKIIKKLNI